MTNPITHVTECYNNCHAEPTTTYTVTYGNGNSLNYKKVPKTVAEFMANHKRVACRLNNEYLQLYGYSIND